MTVASLASAAAGPPSYRVLAFGLDVRCEWQLPGAFPAAASTADGPLTHVCLLDKERIDAEWAKPAERIFQPEYPDGRTRFTIDRGPTSYRLWFEGFGRLLVRLDGTEVGCERTTPALSHAERFLFAQGLPLAAALHGFEPLHASAICGKTAVAAFSGPSGSGKTTLASRLVMRGAGFVTDDVLVLDRTSHGAMTHPGPAFMALANHELPLIANRDRRLGAPIGTSDKLHASPRPVARNLPLRVLFHLEPGPSIELEAIQDDQALRLLASGFAPYLMTPERLVRHLDMAHTITQTVSQFRLRVPRTASPDAVVETVECKLRMLAI